MLITNTAMSPPTMTMANGRCESEPIPCEVAAGTSPSDATSMVMRMGRNRMTAPCCTASRMECPRARNWLMYSSMITPVITETPNSARNPMPEETLKLVLVKYSASDAADGRHGDRHQNQAGPFHRSEHGIEDQVNDQQRQRDDHHEPPLGALLAGVFAGPIDVVAGWQLHLLIHLLDRLLAPRRPGRVRGRRT